MAGPVSIRNAQSIQNYLPVSLQPERMSAGQRRRRRHERTSGVVLLDAADYQPGARGAETQTFSYRDGYASRDIFFSKQLPRYRWTRGTERERGSPHMKPLSVPIQQYFYIYCPRFPRPRRSAHYTFMPEPALSPVCPVIWNLMQPNERMSIALLAYIDWVHRSPPSQFFFFFSSLFFFQLQSTERKPAGSLTVLPHRRFGSSHISYYNAKFFVSCYFLFFIFCLFCFSPFTSTDPLNFNHESSAIAIGFLSDFDIAYQSNTLHITFGAFSVRLLFVFWRGNFDFLFSVVYVYEK